MTLHEIVTQGGITSQRYEYTVLHIFRAILCLCHGVTEHVPHYRSFAESLAECEILVFGNDQGMSGSSSYKNDHIYKL